MASYCRQVSSVLQSLFKKPQHLKLVADYSTISSSYRVFPQATREIRWQITCHKACTTRIFFFSNIIIFNGNNLLFNKTEPNGFKTLLLLFEGYPRRRLVFVPFHVHCTRQQQSWPRFVESQLPYCFWQKAYCSLLVDWCSLVQTRCAVIFETMPGVLGSNNNKIC